MGTTTEEARTGIVSTISERRCGWLKTREIGINSDWSKLICLPESRLCDIHLLALGQGLDRIINQDHNQCHFESIGRILTSMRGSSRFIGQQAVQDHTKGPTLTRAQLPTTPSSRLHLQTSPRNY